MAARREGEQEPHPALWLAPAAMLVLALAPWPYGYYQLLRLVVCGAAAFLAYREFKRLDAGLWTLGLGLVALVFNPVVPLHMTRSAWAVVDLGTAAALAFHFRVRRVRGFPPRA